MAYVGIVNGSYAHWQEEPAYFTVVVLFSAFLLFGSVLTSKQKKTVMHQPLKSILFVLRVYAVAVAVMLFSVLLPDKR